MSTPQEKNPSFKGAPHREDFSTEAEYNAAYLAHLQIMYGLDPDDRILTTVSACLNNSDRWDKGSDRARGG